MRKALFGSMLWTTVTVDVLPPFLTAANPTPDKPQNYRLPIEAAQAEHEFPARSWRAVLWTNAADNSAQIV